MEKGCIDKCEDFWRKDRSDVRNYIWIFKKGREGKRGRRYIREDKEKNRNGDGERELRNLGLGNGERENIMVKINVWNDGIWREGWSDEIWRCGGDNKWGRRRYIINRRKGGGWRYLKCGKGIKYEKRGRLMGMDEC